MGAKFGGVRLAILFGSLAAGREWVESDLDGGDVMCGDHASWIDCSRVRSQGLDEPNPICSEALAVIRNREDT